MNIKNTKIDGQYLTLLQKNFINNPNINDCEELLAEMESLNYGPFEITYEKFDINAKIDVFSPTNEEESVGNIFEYIPKETINFNYLNIKRHIFKTMFFSKLGNENAKNILKKINNKYPEAHYLDNYANFLKVKKNKNSEFINHPELKKYSELHSLFSLYLKDESNYDKLADFWNENIDFWHKNLFERTVNGALWDKEVFIRFVQQDIGNTIFLDFMANPTKHINFSKRMPNIVDLLNWYDDDLKKEHKFFRLLIPFFKNEHFETLANFKQSCNYENFIEQIFNVNNYSDSNLDQFNNLNNLVFLIKNVCSEKMNIDVLFSNKFPIQSLSDFYSTREYQNDFNGGTYLKLNRQFSQFIFKSKLETDLTINENNGSAKKIKI